ncbi:uncharacterized protein SCODWIG_03441 [Saccharomycodes ludwigii]|uniref:Protein DSE1 n=1 Tax=Saccharomycodes ludwigii TaxID=36035 RepID=A0A376BC28_9ASCO|nr:hypothetical protein SCDLUD_001412 [Saccharomycodes ludwigii]KAH3901645.1 hypothetical protein SCDLUD_001412 [Saccharomycodes ludwigii]SSD61680.1 uncharacterized protein SCODWIG_03441 [Saccharomycodes ludwigii]
MTESTFFKKKIQSEYWNNQIIDSGSDEHAEVTSLSTDNDTGTILVSTSSNVENLKIFQTTDKTSESEQEQEKTTILRTLQKITVPGEPISTSELVTCNQDNTFITCAVGHQNGRLNIIKTDNKNYTKIIKHYNYSKYFFSTKTSHQNKYIIKKIQNWNNGQGVCSSINEAIAISDLNSKSSTPLYFNSFEGLESFAINPVHSTLLCLTWEKVIGLLDLREDEYFTPSSSLTKSSSNNDNITPNTASHFSSSYNYVRPCCWLNEYSVATVDKAPNVVNIWDIRKINGKLMELHHADKDMIQDLKYSPRDNFLYTSDMIHGTVVAWELLTNGAGTHDTNAVLKCTTSGNNSDIYSRQCGNVILDHYRSNTEINNKPVHNGNNMIGLVNNSLLTLDNNKELGIHKICNIMKPLLSVNAKSIKFRNRESKNNNTSNSDSISLCTSIDSQRNCKLRDEHNCSIYSMTDPEELEILKNINGVSWSNDEDHEVSDFKTGDLEYTYI